MGFEHPLEPGKLYNLLRQALDLTPSATRPLDGFGGAEDLLDSIEGPYRGSKRSTAFLQVT